MIGNLIPVLKPDVENQLLRYLADEVEIYSQNITGKRCLLCPFRVLSRTFHLRRHLVYHCKENMYLADKRSPQRYIVRSIFDQRIVSSSLSFRECFTPDLLQQSAILLSK